MKRERKEQHGSDTDGLQTLLKRRFPARALAVALRRNFYQQLQRRTSHLAPSLQGVSHSTLHCGVRRRRRRVSDATLAPTHSPSRSLFVCQTVTPHIVALSPPRDELVPRSHPKVSACSLRLGHAVTPVPDSQKNHKVFIGNKRRREQLFQR